MRHNSVSAGRDLCEYLGVRAVEGWRLAGERAVLCVINLSQLRMTRGVQVVIGGQVLIAIGLGCCRGGAFGLCGRASQRHS